MRYNVSEGRSFPEGVFLLARLLCVTTISGNESKIVIFSASTEKQAY